MDVARDVVDLFNEKDMESARKIAGRLDQLNAERQEEERRIMRASNVVWKKNPRCAKPTAWCSTTRAGIARDWHYGVAGGGTPRAANAGHLA